MPSDRLFLIVISISFKIILNKAFLLSHGAERSMGNIFQVSHILQHISNKQVEVKTASTNRTWFYFYLHISILQFVFQHVLCSFVLYSMVFCNQFVSECFVPNIPLLLKTRTC